MKIRFGPRVIHFWSLWASATVQHLKLSSPNIVNQPINMILFRVWNVASQVCYLNKPKLMSVGNLFQYVLQFKNVSFSPGLNLKTKKSTWPWEERKVGRKKGGSVRKHIWYITHTHTFFFSFMHKHHFFFSKKGEGKSIKTICSYQNNLWFPLVTSKILVDCFVI